MANYEEKGGILEVRAIRKGRDVKMRCLERCAEQNQSQGVGLLTTLKFGLGKYGLQRQRRGKKRTVLGNEGEGKFLIQGINKYTK